MKRIRFNLRTVLITIALVAVFLTYAQWRRQRILREAQEIESQGFTLLWQDKWTHWIWPIIPNEAKFEFYDTSDGKWIAGSNAFQVGDDDAINFHFSRGANRLTAMGVESVRVERSAKPPGPKTFNPAH